MSGIAKICLFTLLFPALLTGQDFDVKFYGIDVEADDASDHIRGQVSILLEALDPLQTISLDLHNELEVSKVELGNREVQFTHNGDILNISIGEDLLPGVTALVRISYGGKTGGGMQREIDREWNIPVTYTSTEPFFAKDWFPCKQDLKDKADSVHVSITTAYHLKALSQGQLTSTTYFPDGRVRYQWKSHYPIAYYLISIAVADYLEYTINAHPSGLPDPIPIQNFVYDRPGCLDTYREQIDVTVPIMELFCERFGPYPFRKEKYGHYLWPRGGGMEHQTMTGMGHFEFYLVAHELGHSWFGNYVTCATWQDIWINEGFATFAGYMATEVLGPEYAPGERDYRFNQALQEAEGSVYIPAHEADNVARIFSGSLSYNKGMAIIYMLRYELPDDELFYNILRVFLERYADSTATGLDFKAVLEEMSGRDFTTFFDQWYFGAGYPSFDVSWTQEGPTVNMEVEQSTSSGLTPLFEMHMEYRIYWNGGDTTLRLWHDESTENYSIMVRGEVTRIEVDPDNHLLDGGSSVLPKSAISMITVFPNPVIDAFNIGTRQREIQNLQIRLYSAGGSLVHQSYREALSPAYPVEIRPGALEPGLYLLHVSAKGLDERKIIMVQ